MLMLVSLAVAPQGEETPAALREEGGGGSSHGRPEQVDSAAHEHPGDGGGVPGHDPWEGHHGEHDSWREPWEEAAWYDGVGHPCALHGRPVPCDVHHLGGVHQLGGAPKPWKAEHFYNLTFGPDRPSWPTGGPPPQWEARKQRELHREAIARENKVRLRRRTEAALKECCTQCGQDARYGQVHGVGCKCGPCDEAPQSACWCTEAYEECPADFVWCVVPFVADELPQSSILGESGTDADNVPVPFDWQTDADRPFKRWRDPQLAKALYNSRWPNRGAPTAQKGATASCCILSSTPCTPGPSTPRQGPPHPSLDYPSTHAANAGLRRNLGMGYVSIHKTPKGGWGPLHRHGVSPSYVMSPAQREQRFAPRQNRPGWGTHDGAAAPKRTGVWIPSADATTSATSNTAAAAVATAHATALVDEGPRNATVLPSAPTEDANGTGSNSTAPARNATPWQRDTLWVSQSSGHVQATTAANVTVRATSNGTARAPPTTPPPQQPSYIVVAASVVEARAAIAAARAGAAMAAGAAAAVAAAGSATTDASAADAADGAFADATAAAARAAHAAVTAAVDGNTSKPLSSAATALLGEAANEARAAATRAFAAAEAAGTGPQRTTREAARRLAALRGTFGSARVASRRAAAARRAAARGDDSSALRVLKDAQKHVAAAEGHAAAAEDEKT